MSSPRTWICPAVGSSNFKTGAPDGGFSASAFADQAKGFSVLDVKAHAVDRIDLADLAARTRPCGSESVFFRSVTLSNAVSWLLFWIAGVWVSGVWVSGFLAFEPSVSGLVATGIAVSGRCSCAGSQQSIGMPARDPVPGTVFKQWWILCVTFIGGIAASRRKRTAGRQIGKRWHHAFDFIESCFLALIVCRLAQGRNRAKQTGCIGVAGLIKQRINRGLLDLSAGVHDDDAVGVLGDHAHVVGDEHDGGPERVLHLAHAGRGSAPEW